MGAGSTSDRPSGGFPAPTEGNAGPPSATPVPPPPAAATTPPAVPPPPPSAAASPESPTLPPVAAREPPPMTGPRSRSLPASWYRSEHDRSRSVRRRANPWYRRLARGLVALAFVGATAVAVYFGADALQDLLDRDRLPAPGPEVPAIRSTSFEVRSSAPAPEVDGTLTIDTTTGVYEFVGRDSGPQAGVQVVSPDGSAVFIRQDTGAWRPANPTDGVVAELDRTIGYLGDGDTADAILTNRLRRGYVELVDRATEGVGDEQLARYELMIDTAAFADEFPLQWQSFQRDAIPGIEVASEVPVTIWLDVDAVLVRVHDEQTGWSWERLAYSDQAFHPVDPSSAVGG